MVVVVVVVKSQETKQPFAPRLYDRCCCLLGLGLSLAALPTGDSPSPQATVSQHLQLHANGARNKTATTPRRVPAYWACTSILRLT